MTLLIELSPETEYQLSHSAAASGQALQDYARAILEQAAQQRAQEDAEDNAAAEAALQDYERNGGKPWAEVRQELGLA